MKTASEYFPARPAIDACAYLLRKTRLTTPEVSVYLQVHHGIQLAASTLCKMRCRGEGPMPEKFGRAILYSRADVDKWVRDRLIRPAAPVSTHETGTGV